MGNTWEDSVGGTGRREILFCGDFAWLRAGSKDLDILREGCTVTAEQEQCYDVIEKECINLNRREQNQFASTSAVSKLRGWIQAWQGRGVHRG